MWPFTPKRQPPEKRSPGVVVLGQQLADACNAEQARVAKGNTAPSPIGPTHYNPQNGDLDLSNPHPLPTDDALAEVCRHFAASDATARTAMRDSTTMDDFYTLLDFARRAAVFALRDKQIGHITNGLAAIALIDRQRIDFRDAMVALSLLYTATRTNGHDLGKLVRSAAALAEPGVSKLMLDMLTHEPENPDSRRMGYVIVQTDAGPGFVACNSAPYNPSAPLERIGFALCRLVQADKYQPTLTLGADLPKVWLAGINDALLSKALQSAVAGIVIHAKLHPDASPDHAYQQWTLFLVELADAPSATDLETLAREKLTRQNNFALLATKADHLFCLVIARSFMVGKPAFETPQSLARFAPGITKILNAS